MFRFVLGLLCLLLIACSAKQENPELFLPTLKSPEGVDLSSLRNKYCAGINVWFDDSFLTPENFRAVFNCANYDSSLEPLKPLLTNINFPEFLKNINLVLKSDGTKELKDTLQTWFSEGADGKSKADRLLPTLSEIIKHPSFQAALPLMSSILKSGENIWQELLPRIADLLYQPRFPDNFADIWTLFENTNKDADDSSNNLKKFARFVKTDLEHETVARRVLELAKKCGQLTLPNTSIPEYLDHVNVKGVVASLYQETGELRGEKINPKLNSDPDEEELENGWNLTPEERRLRAKQKLFKRGVDGSDAPIVQLAGLVSEFHQPHQDFIPAISRWVSANGAVLNDGLFEYISKSLIINGLTKLNIESFFLEYADKQKLDLTKQVEAKEYSQFLLEAFASEHFSNWINANLLEANKEFFGEKNAELISNSKLSVDFLAVYSLPEVSAFASVLIPADKKITLASAFKRFSNLHRGEKLKIVFRGKKESIEPHLIEAWQDAAKKTLGESVVVKFTIELMQTLFSQFASDFSNKNVSIAQWYFSSTYGSPDGSEALAGYAFKELALMEKYKTHKDYLKTTFAQEVFPDENDRRAFAMLVDQIPNIWIYIKSGSARSGNDITRALSSKDQGYLINNYVQLISNAYDLGIIKDGALILEEYFNQFGIKSSTPIEDSIENRRKISKATDSLKRVLASLFEPQEEGNYHSATFWQIMQPFGSIIDGDKIEETEKFILVSMDQILGTSDDVLNHFISDFSVKKFQSDKEMVESRENLKAISELLKQKNFPAVIYGLNHFFQDEAVKPALDFLSKKIDDGSLGSVLLFIRRILGFASGT